MGNLVFIQDGKAVTDTLTVAEVFEKQHKDVLRDIRNLGCSQEFAQRNFAPSSYINSQNKEMPMYYMSNKGFTMLVMGYTGPKAMVFKEKYIEEFERMEEELKNQSIKSNERGHLQSVMKLAFYHEEDIKVIKEDIEELKTGLNERLTVDYGQQRAIENAKKTRVRYLWENGVINREVHDTVQKVYAAMGRDLKDVFAVNSYRDIRQKDFDESIQYIKAWRPRLV